MNETRANELNELLVKLQRAVTAEDKALAVVEALDDLHEASPLDEAEYLNLRDMLLSMAHGVAEAKRHVLMAIISLGETPTIEGIPF